MKKKEIKSIIKFSKWYIINGIMVIILSIGAMFYCFKKGIVPDDQLVLLALIVFFGLFSNLDHIYFYNKLEDLEAKK